MFKHKLHRIALIIGLYAALVCVLFMTNPQNLPIVLLMLPSALLFAALFVTIITIIEKFFPSVTKRKRMFYAACISGAPTFMLILSSINQLTWKDAVLGIILVLALLFYAGRINFSRT